jgi:hypothetical protein
MKLPHITIIFFFFVALTTSHYPAKGSDDKDWIQKIVDKLNVTEYYLTTDQENNLLITGYFINKVDFGNNKILVAIGNYDIFIAKYNRKGDLLWLAQLGSDRLDIAQQIKTDNIGNVFVTGYISGISLFEEYIVKPKGSYDIFTVKYSSEGKLQWVKCEGAEIICETNEGKRKKILNNFKSTYSYKN